MGAAENAAIVRRGYEAFNAGDIDALTEIFDESAVWHAPGRNSLAGDYEGREATFAYLGQLGQKTAGTFRAELGTCSRMTTTTWSAFSAAARSETAGAWTLATASCSSSTTVGLPRSGAL